MNPRSDVDAVMDVARRLGLTLDVEEARVIRDQIVAKMTAIEEFMRSRISEDAPPLSFPERAPGHRPSAEEDPFGAWLWKCEIHGASDGLLAGKTVGLKDHIAVCGMPLTLGSYLMEGHIATFDATVVTRLLAAGATIVGKNTMTGPTSGWGYGLPSDYQRTLNPHDPRHLPGASSSGSAAAVAAGEVDIAFGGDQGGSIRGPAAYCGVYGLKPTFGLVSHFGVGFGSDQSLDHVGPLARRAEDLAAALDAVAGYDANDPRQDRDVPLRIDSLGRLADGVKGLRLGVVDEGLRGAKPHVRDAVLGSVDILKAAGATAVQLSLPEFETIGLAYDALEPEGTRAVFDIGFFGAFARTYYPPSLIAATYDLFHSHSDHLTPRRKLILILSELVRRQFHGTVYARAQNVRKSLRKTVDAALGQVDLLVTPTCPDVAPAYVEPSDYLEVGLGIARSTGVSADWSTKPFNYTGHPALSVPCGKFANLPMGMQLIGAYYAEPLMLRAAYAFQHSVDWERYVGLSAAATGDSPDRDMTDPSAS